MMSFIERPLSASLRHTYDTRKQGFPSSHRYVVASTVGSCLKEFFTDLKLPLCRRCFFPNSINVRRGYSYAMNTMRTLGSAIVRVGASFTPSGHTYSRDGAPSRWM